MLEVSLIQQNYSANRVLNLKKTLENIRRAAAQGAQLILLSELHAGLYFCQTQNVAHFDDAETLQGETITALAAIARQLKLIIVATIFEKRLHGLYHNTAVVIEKNGDIAGLYRKMHIPDDPGFNEKFYFAPGDLGFTPIQTSLGKLGILICWDQWYPEAARLMTLAGADILLFPTAIGWGSKEYCELEKKRQCDAWITIQRAHAIANGLPILVCNRVGFEAIKPQQKQGIFFWGNSFICGPQGEILAVASQQNAGILSAKISLEHTENVRRAWPFLRDRRIDAYQDLLKRSLD